MYNLKRKQAAIDLLIFHPASPLEGPKVHLPFTAEFNLWRSWVSPAWRLAPAQDRQAFSQAWGKRAKTSVEDECLSWTQLCPTRDTEESCPVELCGLCTLHSGERQPQVLPPLEQSLACPLHSPELLFHQSISWGFTSRPYCLQGKEEWELNNKNHLVTEFGEFPGTTTWGAIFHAYSMHGISWAYVHRVFLTISVTSSMIHVKLLLGYDFSVNYLLSVKCLK